MCVLTGLKIRRLFGKNTNTIHQDTGYWKQKYLDLEDDVIEPITLNDSHFLLITNKDVALQWHFAFIIMLVVLFSRSKKSLTFWMCFPKITIL